MNEVANQELLENILTAQVLTLARILKDQQTVMDESINPTDFHAEAMAEIKQNRSGIIAGLLTSRGI